MPWWNTESEEFDGGDYSTHNAAEEQAAADHDASIGSSSHQSDVTNSYIDSSSALDSVAGDEWHTS